MQSLLKISLPTLIISFAASDVTLMSITPLPTANDSAKITLLEILERAIFAPEYLKRKIIASVNFALGITLFKIINGFFLSSLAICKKGRVAIKSRGLGCTGTNTPFDALIICKVSKVIAGGLSIIIKSYFLFIFLTSSAKFLISKL